MPTRLLRRISTVSVFGLLLTILGCGSSAVTSTSTAPSPLTRCAVTVNGPSSNVPAQGGTGTVAVTAARECAWTASVDGPWLSIKSGATGQGDGSVEFVAAVNPDPATRRGAIVLNDARADVTQAAGECVITLAEPAAMFGQSGGSGRVEVRASSQMCAWKAETDVNWIVVRSGADGKGTAPVMFDVMPATGPTRSGSIRVAGQQFSVTQSQGCAYAITPSTFDASATGAAGSIAIATTAGCAWTAASHVSWLTLSTAAGEGPGAVSFTVAPGSTRSGTATIAGQTFTVTQTQGCTYAISPSSFAAPPNGGSGTVTVTTDAACAWTAASTVSWLTLSPAAGTGPGTTAFTVAPASGASRAGTAVIGGQTFSVTQGQGCTFSVDPVAHTVPAAGGSVTVQITAPAGCAWTVSSGASWVTVSGAATGTGTGTVQLAVAPTTGTARSGNVTVAGATVTINQSSGCAIAIAPNSAQLPAEGGSGKVAVTGAPGCAWTAASSVPWVQITAGAAGNGSGDVLFTVAVSSEAARTGTLNIGGQTFTIIQSAACAYVIDPEQHTFDGAGGTVSVAVRTPSGCRWSTSSNAPWISLRSMGGESGDGVVQVTAVENPGAARAGTATIAGRTFTVQQTARACTYVVKPLTIEVDEDSQGRGIDIDTQFGCSWAAVSNVPWIRVIVGGSGSGAGAIWIVIEAHESNATRKGTLTVAGQTVEVTQKRD